MDSQKASAQAVTLPMCQWLGTERADDHLVAWSATREYRQRDFRRDVATLFASVSVTPCSRWALCLEDNYSFAVALLAVLYSGKTPVLPGHFRQAQLSEQCDEFDALITDLPLQLNCPVLRFPFVTLEPLPFYLHFRKMHRSSSSRPDQRENRRRLSNQSLVLNVKASGSVRNGAQNWPVPGSSPRSRLIICTA